MATRSNASAKSDDLRGRAEVRLRNGRPERAAQASNSEVVLSNRRLLHELQVHQVELEMQNAELADARDRLEATLKSYTDLYEYAPVGYFTLAVDGTIKLVNLTGTKLVGMNRTRLVGKPFELIVAEEFRRVFNSFLKRVFAAGTKHACEVTLVGAGRSPRVVNIEADRSLSRRDCRAVVMDITERKQAEEIMRRNEALFSALIEQAPVGVYVVDDQLRLQKINPKARPVFRDIQPWLGRDLSEALLRIWPDRLANEILERFQHTLKTGRPDFSDFSERRRDTGVAEFHEWQLQRLTLPDGDHGVACFFNDVTARKRAEATQRRMAVLSASNRKLENEIIRRQAVENSLKESEKHQGRLLAQSRQLQDQLRQLSRQVLRAQEEERLRISRELHDVIAQSLTGINLRLAMLKKSTSVDVKDLDLKIESTQRMVEESVEIVHQFARELRPAVLDDLGLIPALHSYLKEFTALTGVRTSLTAFAAVDRLDSSRRTILYRVAQEALTNVTKHAGAIRVKVIIRKLPDCICMTIADDGRSFDVSKVQQGVQGLGLLGMRERLEMIGGHFEIQSKLNQGTIITARIPLRNDASRRTKKSY